MYDVTLIRNVGETKPPYVKNKLPRHINTYLQHFNIQAPNKKAFFSMETLDLNFFCIGAKYYLWFTFVNLHLCEWKYIKGVSAVEIWRISVIFLFSTYNYGKNQNKFWKSKDTIVFSTLFPSKIRYQLERVLKKSDFFIGQCIPWFA